MKRSIEGLDRSQTTLLPDCIDDYVDDDNPVRAIDAFVDMLDLGALGFDVEPEVGGPPWLRPRDDAEALHLRLSEPGAVIAQAGA